MSIQSDLELSVTREKLGFLEQSYAEIKQSPGKNSRADVLTLQSFKKLINQLKEEIGRFEARIRSGVEN